VELHAPAVLPLGKNPQLNRRLGGPDILCCRFGEEINVLPLPEFRQVDKNNLEFLAHYVFFTFLILFFYEASIHLHFAYFIRPVYCV
jgi:hypothetical protein